MASEPKNSLPNHIAFIMDGNRTWAKRHNKSLKEGYLKGSDALLGVIYSSLRLGIKAITVFAFSTENWKRSDKENKILMLLFKKGVTERAEELHKLGVRVKFVGQILDFPSDVRRLFKKLEEQTKNNQNLDLNVAVSYGGKMEIIDATKKIIKEKIPAEKLSEKTFTKYLYTNNPDPELIVRTSGVPRLSGFLMWQSAYAELYFTNTLWPDFNSVELDKALDFYAKIKRNFGK